MRMDTTGRCLLGLLTLSATSALSAGLTAQVVRPSETRSTPMEIVCGPMATIVAPAQTVKVIGGTERVKTMFATGETILINAGTTQGIRAGQHFYVRRVIEDRFAANTADVRPKSLHTAGWVTIVETQSNVSVATIKEACDGVQEGDYLEPLVLPEPGAAVAAGVPDFARPGRVLLGDDRRQLGATGSMMVLDRGTDHGVRAGQRLTIFRDTVDGTGPVITIGDAIVVSTQAESSLMKIQHSREAIQVGDKVAIHR
jgi:hypothetical protein